MRTIRRVHQPRGMRTSWAEGTFEVCVEISVIGYQRPAPSFSDNAVSAPSICSAAGGFST